MKGISHRRLVVSACAIAIGVVSAAWASSVLLRVRVGAAEELVTEREGARRWSLLSAGQKHALGATEGMQREAFVALLREEALLASGAEDARLTARFAVAEVQRRVLARAAIDAAGGALGPASSVSDELVRAYYDEHRGTFEAPARVQVWRILCKTEAQAREVLAKARGGIAVQDWMNLARETSIDEATKLRGGTLGFIDAKGISDDAPVSADPGVAAAAWAATDGAIVTTVVPERGAFAVVWRRSSLPAVTRTLDEVAAQIRATLWRDQREAIEDAAVKKIVAARVSLVNDDALTAIDELVVKAYTEKHGFLR